MKKNLLSVITVLFLTLLSKTTVFSQVSVVSSNGYTVNITVVPKSIITYSASCQYGYTYAVKLDYNVSFTGTNIPKNLYTLQGTIGCGSSSIFFDLPNNGGIGSVNSSNEWTAQTNCATATAASLGCGKISITIEGPGISNRTISTTISNSPLPVSLLDFNATVEKAKVKLTWKTAIELDNDHFTVERSFDGNSWEVVKNIPGAKNSTTLQSYECYDENPYAGTAYYRLKQTDIDGKFTYSGVREVKMTDANSNTIFAYPNPNTGSTLNFKGITDPSKVLLTVHDASGSSVFSVALTSNSVEIPSLKPGLYLVSLKNKVTGDVTNLKYVKM
ncbi:MAG: T9SS type A sorting domain-containing protein [Chitinophagaceae bacterium]|nr:T9SS type A sorting domain-containing protein [Chitinophagaceae bacterium]